MKTVEITYRYDPGHKDARARPVDADGAAERLDEGNRAFAALLDHMAEGSETVRRVISVDPRDFGMARGRHHAPTQQPYAAVLGCSDARVPVELVFNEGPNDLFVVRVAGNGLGDEVLGSLKYAADHLGNSMKVVVVLGHSGCGAVTSAVDVFLDPRQYLALSADHALRTILDRLLIVVHTVASRLQAAFGPGVAQRASYRAVLVEASILLNAALTAYTLQQALGARTSGCLQTRYGVYVISTRRIWAPRVGSVDCDGLAAPPADAGGFPHLAEAIVRSPRLLEILAEDGAATVAHAAEAAAPVR